MTIDAGRGVASNYCDMNKAETASHRCSPSCSQAAEETIHVCTPSAGGVQCIIIKNPSPCSSSVKLKAKDSSASQNLGKVGTRSKTAVSPRSARQTKKIFNVSWAQQVRSARRGRKAVHIEVEFKHKIFHILVLLIVATRDAYCHTLVPGNETRADVQAHKELLQPQQFSLSKKPPLQVRSLFQRLQRALVFRSLAAFNSACVDPLTVV